MFDVKEKQIRRRKIRGMQFLRSIIQYRMADHECEKDVKEELGITGTNTVITGCQYNG
jgi:hypothetical protein